MTVFFNSTFIPPPAGGSEARKLFETQDAALSSVLTTRIAGGQASLIVRDTSAHVNPGFDALQAMIVFYESPQNRSQTVTTILTKIQTLKFTQQTNSTLSVFLTTLQSHIQDLRDAQYQMDPVYEKSVITSSMQHPEYKAMNDGFINNTTITASEMIAQFMQKETRDAAEITSQGGRRNINFSDSGGNSRRGNGNGRKQSDSWIEKEIWSGMTIEERKAHLKKHRKPRKEEQSEQPSDALAVPTSNYSNANA